MPGTAYRSPKYTFHLSGNETVVVSGLLTVGDTEYEVDGGRNEYGSDERTIYRIPRERVLYYTERPGMEA